LLEVMVAVFIFSLIMIAASYIFVKAFQGYRNARAIQKDLENAQYTMNLMAKTIRTSSIISSGTDYVRIFDYSQTAGNGCIEYRFNNSENKIKAGSTHTTDKASCTGSTSITLSDLSNVYVDKAVFSVVKSESGKVGKVTISMKVCPPSGCSGSEKI